MERKGYFIKEVIQIYPINRTKLYELLKSGDIRAYKSGGRTVILKEDAKAYFSKLPQYQPRHAA